MDGTGEIARARVAKARTGDGENLSVAEKSSVAAADRQRPSPGASLSLKKNFSPHHRNRKSKKLNTGRVRRRQRRRPCRLPGHAPVSVSSRAEDSRTLQHAPQCEKGAFFGFLFLREGSCETTRRKRRRTSGAVRNLFSHFLSLFSPSFSSHRSSSFAARGTRASPRSASPRTR